MNGSRQRGSNPDRGMRDAPWLAPESVDLIEIEWEIVEPETPRCGLQTTLSAPAVRVGIPSSVLLPRWWIEGLRRRKPETFSRFAGSALSVDHGPFASFQQHGSGYQASYGVLPGWEERTTRERRALDPLFEDRLVNPGGLLDRFLALEDQPRDYLAFAQESGAIGLCSRHGVPISYCQLTRRGGGCRHLHPEPLLYWRFCVEFAAAAVRVGRALRDQNPDHVEEGDWAVVSGRSPVDREAQREAFENRTDTYWNAAGDFSRAVNGWLRLAGVGLSLRWLPGRGAELEDTGVGLFGGLAKRLAHTVAGAEPRVSCWECGRLYAPSEKPRSGERSFCPRCRKNKAPQKWAQRDYRRRKELLQEIVEDRLDGPREDREFWKRVQQEWEREGQDPHPWDELRERYRNWWGE